MMMGGYAEAWWAVALTIIAILPCAMVTSEGLGNVVRWFVRGCRWENGNRGHDEAAAQAAPAPAPAPDPETADDQIQEAETATADNQIQEAATATADDQIQEAATAIADDQIQEQVDHPSLEGQVGVEYQGSQEAVAAPPLAAADHPGLEDQVGGECQGGQEAVAAPPAGGGILTETEEDDEEMMMKRLQKGKKKEEEKGAQKEEEEEGAECTTLRIDVDQGNTSTSVITTVSTTSISFVTESDQGRQNYNWVHHHNSRRSRTNVISLQDGATGSRRVTWSLTVTTMRDNEDTALAPADVPSGRHSS